MGHHRQTHIDIVRNRFFVFRGRRCESADAFMRVLKISSVKGVRRKLLQELEQHRRSTTVYTRSLQHLPSPASQR